MNSLRYCPPERRRHPRTQLRMTLHGIRLDPDGGDVHDTLLMKNISRGGMGAIADRWLYPGQKIVLRLPLYPDCGRRNLSATVVRCQKSAEGFEVGLRFDHVGLDSAARHPQPVAAAA